MYELNNQNEAVIWKKWDKLVMTSEAIHLRMAPVKPSYNRKRMWLETTVATSIKVVQSVDEVLGTNVFDEIVANAVLTKQDEKLIELEVAKVCEYIESNADCKIPIPLNLS